MEIVDGAVSIIPSGAASMADCIYTAGATVTDYQVISIVMQDLGPGGTVRIYGRLKSDRTEGIKVELVQSPDLDSFQDSVRLSVFTPSVSNILATEFITLQPGATYSLICGTLAGVRYFQVLCNGTVICAGNDSTSSIGSNYRSGGFAQINYFVSGVELSPPTIKGFSISDNTLGIFPGPPATSNVATSQATSSTSYTDLATTGPEVTVRPGASGAVLVGLSCFGSHASASQGAYMSFAVSGGKTQAASDASMVSSTQVNGQTTIGDTKGRAVLVTGITPGVSTTFTSKYRSTSGSATFAGRDLWALPL